MKFKKGDIVQHVLTGEKMIVVGSLESVSLSTIGTVSNLYSCRMESRLDLVYNFDEIELKEVGTEKI
jgi:hypothetical protein